MNETDWFEGKQLEEMRRARVTVLPWWMLGATGVCVVLAIGLALFSGKVFAEERKPTMSAKDERGNVVRITTEVCPQTPPWMGLHKAEMHYEGKNYEACWVPFGQTVIVFDSNGDITPIPSAAFVKDEVL